MPIQNTLSFTNVNEITFEDTATELKIKVNGTLLGAFNTNFPATVFITNVNGAKTITFKQITNSVYASGNTNNTLLDTIYFNFNLKQCNTAVIGCSTSGSTFKIIGWDIENVGQICTGNGHTNYFNISDENSLKAKVEQVVIAGATVTRLVARYSGPVLQSETPAAAPCYAGLYCFACN